MSGASTLQPKVVYAINAFVMHTSLLYLSPLIIAVFSVTENSIDRTSGFSGLYLLLFPFSQIVVIIFQYG